MSDYSHILLAVDFSPASAQVAGRAQGLVSRYQCRMTILHVVDYLPPVGFSDDFTPSPALLLDERELVASGRRTLARFASEQGLQERPQEVLIGAPHHEIVRYASDNGVDLIVVGSHGRHGLGRLLGSTAAAVVGHSHCDVLAVRIDERA